MKDRLSDWVERLGAGLSSRSAERSSDEMAVPELRRPPS
jgi:hypothetical protein